MTESPTAPPLPATTGAGRKVEYNLPLGYLRAFVIVLVIAHHAALAYHPFAPPSPASLVPEPHWWQAFPVVDSQRWTGFALLVGFNDVFFMSLMFFLSGLFVWNSLQRKGASTFLRDRLLRLGLPFVVAVAILAPLAYYPSYLQTPAPHSFAAFWRQWVSLGSWPSGPAWFIWVLFVFDCLAATLLVLAPKAADALRRVVVAAAHRPSAFFALLITVSAAAYVPMSTVFNAMQWSAFGPFTFQTARILHYLAYFLIAFALGAQSTTTGLFAPGGKLRRRWPLWAITALFAFALLSVVGIAAVTSHAGSKPWAAFAAFTFVISCAASCFAFLAIFLRFANTRTRMFDSLRENSYGIYLLHYFCVSWLQYALLTAPIPAVAKGSTVLLGALALSWAASASLRRIPAVARVI